MDNRSLGRTFLESEKIYRKQVEAAWNAMVGRGELPPARVRELIRESWARCLRDGVEPTAQRPSLVGAGGRLESLRHGNEELLLASQNTWSMLSDVLTDSQSMLVVADPNGVLLDVCGNPSVIDKGERERVSAGYDWSETQAGTNAVGTAIALRQPAEVHSVEHFCAIAKIWTCSAAPVRDTVDGTLLGVIDVTTFSSAYSPQNLALAMTTAHQIEQTLQSRELARSVQLLHWYQASAKRWRRHAVILLDRKGRVLTANEHARALFAALGAGQRLERSQTLRPVTASLALEDCVRYLPPMVVPVALEPCRRSGSWEGGLLVVEPLKASMRQLSRPADPVATESNWKTIFAGIVGESPQLIAAKQRAYKMARARAPVLILGETGCGKELFARAIHQASEVAGGPFVAVNCGTLTKELAASELLGYEAGAFTGASAKGRSGKFEEADGGTLFLDEIGELPVDVQVSLLRVVQDNVVVRIGGSQERHVKVRVIAATNRQLDEDVKAERFRLDLYYRLRVLTLRLAPLREHAEDIELLVETFLRQLDGSYGLGAKRMTAELAARLRSYAWPGNVRELRGVIETMYVLSDGELLSSADLPEELVPGTVMREASGDPMGAATISGLERDTILTALRDNAANRSGIARRLGISRSTLYRKLKQYGID